MGLPKGLKRMLQADATVYSTGAEDEWGNETSTSRTIKCFIDQENAEYRVASEDEGRIKSGQVESVPVITDDEDIKVGDDIEFEGRRRDVVQVATYRNKKGLPLFQIVTTETQ